METYYLQMILNLKNKIMKKQACELWIGTQTRFFKIGEFKSISEAKRYVSECVNCYYEIRKAI